MEHQWYKYFATALRLQSFENEVSKLWNNCQIEFLKNIASIEIQIKLPESEKKLRPCCNANSFENVQWQLLNIDACKNWKATPYKEWYESYQEFGECYFFNMSWTLKQLFRLT